MDVSQRHPASKQLTMEKNAETIANYSNPAFVLGGWKPEMSPLILTQPQATTARDGDRAVLTAKVAAIPAASWQWLKDGKPIPGATAETLTLEHVNAKNAGQYTLMATNALGAITSNPTELKVN